MISSSLDFVFGISGTAVYNKKKSQKCNQTDRLLHRPRTSEYTMPFSSRKLYNLPRLNGYTKEFFFRTSSSFLFSLQLLGTIFDNRLRRYKFLKPVFLLVLQIHHLMKREIDLGTFEEEGDLDDESDGIDQLDLDSEHNDDDLGLSQISSLIQCRAGGAVSFVTPSELVRYLGNTRIDSNILR